MLKKNLNPIAALLLGICFLAPHSNAGEAKKKINSARSRLRGNLSAFSGTPDTRKAIENARDPQRQPTALGVDLKQSVENLTPEQKEYLSKQQQALEQQLNAYPPEQRAKLLQQIQKQRDEMLRGK